MESPDGFRHFLALQLAELGESLASEHERLMNLASEGATFSGGRAYLSLGDGGSDCSQPPPAKSEWQRRSPQPPSAPIERAQVHPLGNLSALVQTLTSSRPPGSQPTTDALASAERAARNLMEREVAQLLEDELAPMLELLMKQNAMTRREPHVSQAAAAQSPSPPGPEEDRSQERRLPAVERVQRHGRNRSFAEQKQSEITLQDVAERPTLPPGGGLHAQFIRDVARGLMEQRALSGDCPSDDHSSIGPYDERPTLAPKEGPGPVVELLLQDDAAWAPCPQAVPQLPHRPHVFAPPPAMPRMPAISPQLLTPPSLGLPRALQPGQQFPCVAPLISPPVWAAPAECGGWGGAAGGGVATLSAPTLPPSPAQWGSPNA